MKTLVIFDSHGVVYLTADGYDEVPEGLSAVLIDVPAGKMVVSMDMSDKENPVPVYEDIPKSELQEQVDVLTECLLEMSEIIYGDILE